MKWNIWQSVRQFILFARQRLSAITGSTSTSEETEATLETPAPAVLMQGDHHELVCNNCWEQFFKNDRLWTQLGLRRSERSDILLRTTGKELLNAAQAPTNCNFCQLVKLCVERQFPKAFAPGPSFSPFPMMALKIVPNTSLVIRFDAGNDQGFEVFNLVVSDEQGTFNLDSFVLNREEASQSSNYSAGSIRDMNLDVGRQQSFELARYWLKECTTRHTDCPSYEAKPLPTRVVDVGSADDPIRPPRLIVTHGSVAPYAALSYCWGQPQQWTTTRDNISDLMTGGGIDLSVVATTIKDAIVATRRLGLQYLWVDSLCIIQDDEEDKRAEISRMRDIYKDAYCTLIIESATDSMDGFLRRQPDPDFPVYHLPLAKPHNGGYTYEVVRLRNVATYNYEPQKAAVNGRAWTMEERLLSQRKLLYTQKQLRWECQSQKRQDGGFPPRGTTGRDPTYVQPFYKVIDAKELETPWSPAYPEPDLKGQDKLRRFWDLLVNEYTARECTNPVDKIRAFGGIAAEFQRVFPEDKYLAGLWKDTLFLGLLWCRNGDVAALPRPAKYRSPSWSWAAIDSEVLTERFEWCLDKEKTAQFFEILDGETTLRSANAPYGEVTAGKITVRGYLRKGRLLSDESARYNKYTVCDEDESEIHWNASLDALGDSEEKVIWCLWTTESTPLIRGLLLVPTVGGGGIYYRRIGVFVSQESNQRKLQVDDSERDWFRKSGERRVIILV
ncbi:heterokaryon incompatibility protein-domain-containing protein [Collybia nuda]|uniref:Heterokaryon incompatibility protein-domain-containing protein n=1 Tax=Collybia nuda TaxID=64659 RepID=A0A9P5XYC8_9AGAR|nr:heterokaryon incompatibility protein-domain-containing protein [Collybia nuda]